LARNSNTLFANALGENALAIGNKFVEEYHEKMDKRDWNDADLQASSFFEKIKFLAEIIKDVPQLFKDPEHIKILELINQLLEYPDVFNTLPALERSLIRVVKLVSQVSKNLPLLNLYAEQASSKTKSMLHAFSNSINYYIDSKPDQLDNDKKRKRDDRDDEVSDENNPKRPRNS
jgi:hypothetical protein